MPVRSEFLARAADETGFVGPARSGVRLDPWLAPSAAHQLGRITPVVKDSHDEKLITTNPVDQGEREPAEQDSAATASGRGECFWIADCRRYCNIDRSSKLKTKAGCTGLVPRLCLQDLGPGLRPKENAH